MGKNGKGQHFDKKNSARAKGRKQEYIPFDGDAFLKKLKEEQRTGTYEVVYDTTTCQQKTKKD